MMRVERTNIGTGDRFEILLGDIVYVKSVEDAKKLADWIYELLDDDPRDEWRREYELAIEFLAQNIPPAHISKLPEYMRDDVITHLAEVNDDI
jgi:hypothetical protein